MLDREGGGDPRRLIGGRIQNKRKRLRCPIDACERIRHRHRPPKQKRELLIRQRLHDLLGCNPRRHAPRLRPVPDIPRIAIEKRGLAVRMMEHDHRVARAGHLHLHSPVRSIGTAEWSDLSCHFSWLVSTPADAVADARRILRQPRASTVRWARPASSSRRRRARRSAPENPPARCPSLCR